MPSSLLESRTVLSKRRVWLMSVWPWVAACGPFFLLLPKICLASALQEHHPWPWCCSVAQPYPTLCDLMDYSPPGSSVLHYLLEFAQIHSVESVMPSNHLILCCCLLLLHSVFPSIRVLSSELVLRIRWPKYWSFSFSIGPSNEYSGLISFRMDWFDHLAVHIFKNYY